MNLIRRTPAPEARLPFVEASKARGKLYLYYRRDGRRQPLPGVEGSEEFLSEYHRIKNEFEAATVRWGVHTVGAAITAYLGSADYGDLSDTSHKEYRRVLDLVRRDFGDLEMAALDGAWITRLRDKYKNADRPHQWLSLRARMIAVEATYRVMHPRSGVGRAWAESKRLKVPVSDQNRAWPDHVLAAVMRAATPEYRAFLTVALLTSQRSGDVCGFSPDAYNSAEKTLRFRQRKTGAEIVLHVPPFLSAIFDEMRGRLPDRLLSTPRGKPWNTANARETMQVIRTRLGLDRYVVHGIRATGPTALRMIGYENAQIRALTGHASDAQLEKYLRGIDKLALATGAQEALVERFSAVLASAADGANLKSYSGVTGRAAAKSGPSGSTRRKLQASETRWQLVPNTCQTPNQFPRKGEKVNDFNGVP